MTLEYELVDANGGIQKVRAEPATRSAVATCGNNYTPGRGKIVPRNINNIKKPPSSQERATKILTTPS